MTLCYHMSVYMYLFSMEGLMQGGQLARVPVMPGYPTQSGGGSKIATDIKVKTS